MEFKKEAKPVLIDFGENTTAHGIPRVTKASSRKGYIFWTSVCIFCTILFLFQAIFLIRRFFRFETSTQIELKFEPVAFPAVTFCNLNPYKNSLVMNENSLQRMLTSFDRALASGTGHQLTQLQDSSSNAQRSHRYKRQISVNSSSLFRPVYAWCDCPDSGQECEPSHQPPPFGQRPQCVCFYEQNTQTVGPCYPDKYWKLTWCNCTREMKCDTARLSNLYSTQEEEIFSNIEPCVCSNISNIDNLRCMATLDKKFDDYWNLPNGLNNIAPTKDPFEEAQSFENVTDPVAIAIQGKINLMYSIASMSLEEKRALSHQKEDLIRMCVFNREQCDIDRDFRVIVDPMYGNCYTFNFDARFNYTNRAGPVFGLRLMLYLDVKEYMPLTQDLGARIAVHTAESFPFPDVFGYNAPAGIVSSFGIRLKTVKRLQSPYGNCSSDAKSQDYIYENYTYSTEGCYRTCRQMALIRECGCGEPRFPVPKNEKHCSADDPVARNCIENATRALGSTYATVSGCDCPQPCEQAVYDTSFSAALWPSGTAHSSMLNCSGTIEECTQHMRENAAAIEVYFEQLNCEYLKESEAYPFVNLLADIGGQLGLWLGFSLITVIELAVLFCDLIKICFKCIRKQSGPGKDVYANYNGDIYGAVSVECTIPLNLKET